MNYWPHGAPNAWSYGNGVVPADNYSHSLQPTQSMSSLGVNASNFMFYSCNTWNSNNTVGSVLECYRQTVPWANFSYDVYGNMSVSSYSAAPSVSGLMPRTSQSPYNAANNRLLEANYGDARGNITALGAVNSIQYDGESRQIYTSDSGTGQAISYLYDGMGQRTEGGIAGGATTFYVHDAFGNLAAEYNSAGVTPDCATCYLSYDELGSVRMVTDQNATIIARHDYLPFGEEIPGGQAGRTASFGFGNGGTITQKFTGQERDGGTATLDYFNARHLSAVTGSFMQPDPMNAGGDILNPQRWNAYAYVLGNPLGSTDPSGMTPCGPGNNICGGVFSSPGRVPSGGLGILNPGVDDTNSGLDDYDCYAAGNSDPCSGNPTGSGGIGIGLGTGSSPSAPRSGFQAPDATGSINMDMVFWIGGYFDNILHFSKSSNAKTPRRFFGTRFCGPGGAGQPINDIDQACKNHDTCYSDFGIDANGNTDASIPWTSQQRWGPGMATKICTMWPDSIQTNPARS